MENDIKKLIIFMKSYLSAKGNMSQYLPEERNISILYQANDCRRARHLEIFVTLYFTLRHNWQCKVVNIAEPQLSLPNFIKFTENRQPP